MQFTGALVLCLLLATLIPKNSGLPVADGDKDDAKPKPELQKKDDAKNDAKDENAGDDEGAEAVTQPPEFSLDLQHKSSSVDHMDVFWNVVEGYEIDHFYITYKLTEGKTSGTKTTTEKIDKDKRKYHIEDSLAWLFIVLGFFAFVCLLSYFLSKRAAAAAAAAAEEAEVNGSSSGGSLRAKPPPNIVIDADDIPFITPEPSQLSPVEHEEYKRLSRSVS